MEFEFVTKHIFLRIFRNKEKVEVHREGKAIQLQRVTCVEENARTVGPQVVLVVEADPFLQASCTDGILPRRLNLVTKNLLLPKRPWLEGQLGQTVETRGRDKEPEAEQPAKPPMCLQEKALMK